MRSRSCLGDVRNPNPNPKPDSTYPVMDAKSLFALCRLVAYPLLYRDKKGFGEARDIQKTVDWLFGLDGFGGSAGQPSPPRRISAAEWHSDASEWVVPQEHTHRPEDFEYTALAIAHRLIKHMVDKSVNVPQRVWENSGDGGEDLGDYLFFQSTSWCASSKPLAECDWERCIIGQL